MASDSTAEPVWIYAGGAWRQEADPMQWSDEDADVLAQYAEAGYTESARQPASPFLAIGLPSEEGLSSAARLSLFVRQDYPQCLIDIEGPAGSTRIVYAQTFPDGLDLMARWAPLAQAGVLTALAHDITEPSPGRAGLVETIAQRVSSVI